MVITSFGLMNVIIGVMVEHTNEVMEREREEMEELGRVGKMEMVTELVNTLELRNDITCDKLLEVTGNFSGGYGEQFKLALDGVNLPHGFDFRSLHQMLDVDCNGLLKKREFTQGMYRLIFSNEFQNGCLIQLATQRIKKQLLELKEEQTHEQKQVQAEMSDMFDRVRRQIAEFRRREVQETEPQIRVPLERTALYQWYPLCSSLERKPALSVLDRGSERDHTNVHLIGLFAVSRYSGKASGRVFGCAQHVYRAVFNQFVGRFFGDKSSNIK